MSYSTENSKDKSVTFCGCGWLGKYFAKQAPEWTIDGTTRSEEKAHRLKELGVSPHVYALGGEPRPLIASLAHDNVVLNIPPGRKGPVDTRFVAHMTQLADTFLSSHTQRLVFISTTSVFGKRNGVVSEDSEREPITASGKAHCEIEDYLLAKQDPRVSVLRLSGLIGDDRHPVKSLAGKRLENGGQPVNLVHVDDVISALKILLTQRVESGGRRVYHLCSTEHPSRKAYYTEAAKRFALSPPLFCDDKGGNSKVVTCEHSLKTLGLTLKYASPIEMLPKGLSK